MIKTALLKQLLNADESELKKLDVEQLRVMLGTFRYFVRLLEREINKRCANQPLGGGIEKIEQGKKEDASKLKSFRI